MSEPAIVVCVLWGEQTVEAVFRSCTTCGRRVALSKVTAKQLLSAGWVIARFACPRCAHRLIEADDSPTFMAPNDETITLLAEQTGRSEADLREALAPEALRRLYLEGEQ